METERKWLVDPARIPYALQELKHYEIEQGYLAHTPTVRIRSIDQREFVLTVKSAPLSPDGLSREEHEFPLPAETYRELRGKVTGRLIEKTRYVRVREDGLKEEIDLFSGELQGLCYLEIEFPDEQTARSFPSPEWTRREVTADSRYTNGSLSRNGLPEE